MLPTFQYRHKWLLFAVLNVVDLFVTWQLWCQGGEQLLDEAHPIANCCLAAYGWIGFVGFQCAVILFGSAWFAIGSRFWPHFGEGGLSVLCFALSSFVVYRGCLASMPPAQCQTERIEAASSEAVLSRSLDRKLHQVEQYHRLIQHWGDKVISRGCTLSEAARQIQQTDRVRDGQWLHYLHRAYGKGYSDEAYPLGAGLLPLGAGLLTPPLDDRRSPLLAAGRIGYPHGTIQLSLRRGLFFTLRLKGETCGRIAAGSGDPRRARERSMS